MKLLGGGAVQSGISLVQIVQAADKSGVTLFFVLAVLYKCGSYTIQVSSPVSP